MSKFSIKEQEQRFNHAKNLVIISFVLAFGSWLWGLLFIVAVTMPIVAYKQLSELDDMDTNKWIEAATVAILVVSVSLVLFIINIVSSL